MQESSNAQTIKQQTSPQAPSGSGSSEVTIHDLFDLFRQLWSKKWIIAGVGLLCAVVLTAGVYFATPVMYEATKKLYMSSSSSLVDLTALQLGDSLATDYAQVFRNIEVHETVRQALRLDLTDRELNNMISVSRLSGTHILVITVMAENEYLALRMVDEYAETGRLFIEARMGGRLPSVFEEATVQPSRRQLPQKAVIGFIAGALVTALLYAAFFFFDTRIKDRSSLEKKAGIAILGAMPPASRS